MIKGGLINSFSWVDQFFQPVKIESNRFPVRFPVRSVAIRSYIEQNQLSYKVGPKKTVISGVMGPLSVRSFHPSYPFKMPFMTLLITSTWMSQEVSKRLVSGC